MSEMKDAKSIFAQTFIYLEMQKDILVFVPEALVFFFLIYPKHPHMFRWSCYVL